MWSITTLPPLRKKATLLSHVQLFETAWTVACQVPPFVGFSGKNTRVSCCFLLQGISPTKGSNVGLLRCRQTLYQLSHQRSPDLLLGALQILEIVTPTDFLNNKDHVDRNKGITAISIVRPIFKKHLHFRYQILIVILVNMESTIFRKYPRSFLSTFSELHHF